MIDIKTFRKVNNITQSQLAEYLNVTKGYISQVESCKCLLSAAKLRELLNNDKGWDVSILRESITQCENVPMKSPAEQLMRSDEVGMLLDRLQAQAEEIGRLKERLECLQKSVGDVRCDVRVG